MEQIVKLTKNSMGKNKISEKKLLIQIKIKNIWIGRVNRHWTRKVLIGRVIRHWTRKVDLDA